VDAAGAAVPGASVEAYDFGSHARGTTGPDGSASLRIPADGKVRWVIGLKSGVGFDYFENYRSKPARDFPPPPPKVTLTLDGARTVRVKAVDSSGDPVAGVGITPWYIGKPDKVDEANIAGCPIVTATTDAAGVAVFDWMPGQVERGVPYLVRPGAYSCPERPLYEPPGPTELSARLLRDTRLSGVVRLPDGHPAAGVLIQADGRGPTDNYCRKFTRTGQGGAYTIEVDPDQSYILAVVDETWAARSFTGVIVREGRPQSGLDFTLIKGTLIHGRVTEGPDEAPAAGAHVILIQEGGSLPEDLRRPDLGEGEARFVRGANVDAEGRYRFRVGPGTYRLLVPNSGFREAITVDGTDEAEIVRDVSEAGPTRLEPLIGRVVERDPAGERPVAGAIIEAVGPGRSPSFTAVADDRGRFREDRIPGLLVLYARAPDGRAAVFTTVPDGAADVTAYVAEAARVTGRVVDAQGHPRPGWRVQVRLDSGPDYASAGHVFRQLRTDDQGRYTFAGAVVGARGEVSTPHQADEWAGGPVSVMRFDVPDPSPVEVPDLIVPPAKPAARK
jgi:hypothetical protein